MLWGCCYHHHLERLLCAPSAAHCHCPLHLTSLPPTHSLFSASLCLSRSRHTPLKPLSCTTAAIRLLFSARSGTHCTQLRPSSLGRTITHAHTPRQSPQHTRTHCSTHTPSDHTNSKRLSFLPSFLLPPYLSFTPRLAFAPSRCRPRPQEHSAARRAGVTRARQTRPGRAPGVSSPCRSRA